MKANTKKRYQNIAKKIDDMLEDESILTNTRIKEAFIALLKSSTTKGMFRLYKAGIRYWITGQYFKMAQQDKDKTAAKKRKKQLDEMLESIIPKPKEDEEKGEWELFSKEHNLNIKHKKFTYKRDIKEKDIKKLFESAETEQQTLILMLATLAGVRTSEFKNVNIIINNNNNNIIFEVKRTKEKQKQEDKNKITRIAYSKQEFVKFCQKFGITKKINLKKELNKLHSRSERAIQREMQKISRKAGYRKPITVHNLRNFFSSEIKKIGDIKTIAGAMGHSWTHTQTAYQRRNNKSFIIPKPSRVEINWRVKIKELNEIDYKNHKKQQEAQQYEL